MGIGIISLDPGAKYVGIARFKDGEFVASAQMGPDEALVAIKFWVRTIDTPHVVYEEFLMYGGGAGKSKTFNTMPELRWIGKLEQLIDEVRPDATVAKYGASVYKAASRAWEPPDAVKGKHMYDAWRLGLWYCLFQLKWPYVLDLRDGSSHNVNSEA